MCSRTSLIQGLCNHNKKFMQMISIPHGPSCTLCTQINRFFTACHSKELNKVTQSVINQCTTWLDIRNTNVNNLSVAHSSDRSTKIYTKQTGLSPSITDWPGLSTSPFIAGEAVIVSIKATGVDVPLWLCCATSLRSSSDRWELILIGWCCSCDAVDDVVRGGVEEEANGLGSSCWM